MNLSNRTKGESDNKGENRLLRYLKAVNAAFTTTLSFLRQSVFVLVKTIPLHTKAAQKKVKTQGGMK